MRNLICRLSRISILSCAFVSVTLSHTAFLGRHAVAGSNGGAWSTTVQPSKVGAYDLEEDGPPEKADTVNDKPDEKKDGASEAKEASLHAVDEKTLSLYPTAAQCGECHKQIYEEWSSSQHAYASISPMFHKFEQKFQELTQGTGGTFCVR